MRPNLMTTLAALAFGLSASAALANPPLKDVEEIREGIITAGIAMELADKCGDLDVRLIRGVSFLNSLKSRAKELGYSAEEIDAYVNDKAEKARLEEVARARIADWGAVEGDESSYCAVGQEQIDQQTAAGRLIH